MKEEHSKGDNAMGTVMKGETICSACNLLKWADMDDGISCERCRVGAASRS